MDNVPAKTDGISYIRIKKSQLADYLAEIRKVENFVPLNPVQHDTERVMIVDRGTKCPQYLIEIIYTEEEN